MSCYQGHGLEVTWSEQEFREFDFAYIAQLLFGAKEEILRMSAHTKRGEMFPLHAISNLT